MRTDPHACSFSCCPENSYFCIVHNATSWDESEGFVAELFTDSLFCIAEGSDGCFVQLPVHNVTCGVINSNANQFRAFRQSVLGMRIPVSETRSYSRSDTPSINKEYFSVIYAL